MGSSIHKFNLNKRRYEEVTTVKLERRWDRASPQLALVHNVEVVSPPIPFSQLLADHHAILQRYLDFLHRLFQYVLEYPCIPDTQVQSLVSNGVFSNRVDRWRSPNLAGIRATHVQKNWRSCTLKNNGSYRMFLCLKSGNEVK